MSKFQYTACTFRDLTNLKSTNTAKGVASDLRFESDVFPYVTSKVDMLWIVTYIQLSYSALLDSSQKTNVVSADSDCRVPGLSNATLAFTKAVHEFFQVHSKQNWYLLPICNIFFSIWMQDGFCYPKISITREQVQDASSSDDVVLYWFELFSIGHKMHGGCRAPL